MARAGMLQKGGKNGTDGGDDVQRSLELLDQVLREYDEGEPRSLEAAAPAPLAPATPGTPATPATDDDSPLAGHTSEDDGYMSMNGRRAKFALGFHPTAEHEEPSPPDPPSPHSPPPPEEAQRIISTLLPKVSPSNSANRSAVSNQEEAETRLDSIISVNGITTATQTTFPKTKHQRPYGWEKDKEPSGFQMQSPPSQHKFSSLQHGARPPETAPNWLPPRRPPPPQKRSPSVESPPVFPFMGFSSEFADKPYNEHPVTIYPGPNIQYNRQSHSPTYNVQKISPLNMKNIERKNNVKRDSRSDGEMLSPKTNIPPRTLTSSMERHREVCRESSEDATECYKRGSRSTEEEHFSDDSLEESLPPPPPPTATTPSKRNSIAWEVSLDGDDPLLTPGSTKVIGRRRRKSGDQSHSSTSSIPQYMDDEWCEEYWPPPPPLTNVDALTSPNSDIDSDNRPTQDLGCGTYVIRKGKSRKQLPSFNKNTSNNPPKADNLVQNISLNRSIENNKSIDESSISISGSGSVGSYNSRPSSDLSLPHSRHSIDLNSRLSRELNTPNSRYSVDICTPSSILSKEITSPKSRLSLDLNNGQDRYVNQEYFGQSPKNIKIFSDKNAHVSKNSNLYNKLSPQNRFTDFKKYSSTFDNIQSLIKEGKMEETLPNECNETVVELPSASPHMVRVVSLPTLGPEGESTSTSRQALITTVEEEEDQESGEHESSGETSPLRKIENNISAILNQGRDQKHFTPYTPKDWNIHKDEYCDDVSKVVIENNYRYNSRERQKRHDIQKSSSHNEIQNQRSIERRERSSSKRSNSMHKSISAKDMPVSLTRQPSSSDSAVSSGGDFPLNVQIVEHSYRHPLPPSPNLGHDMGPLPQTPESPSFPPLPPSPVQEVDDEYTEIPSTENQRLKKSETLPTPTTLDSRRRPSEPPAVPPHRENTNSLKTRSMETGYNKNRRSSNNFKSGSTDRRTLPTDTGVSGARRRTLQRQNREIMGRGSLQTSASLPETPVFARGCDVPRTPPRNSTGPPRNNTMNSIQSIGSSATLGGYGRGSIMGPTSGVCTGADLLRLGGPPRGWYPRQRNRPASIEHIDRLGSSKAAADHPSNWENTGSRKPLTLPPNLTPKFFHKSPREALRRVTSLLIRKGNNGKEKESSRGGKETTSPAARSANGEEHPGQKQRKGFFRNLWKKSRQYSLEHP